VTKRCSSGAAPALSPASSLSRPSQ
jgi:hypothetical protein